MRKLFTLLILMCCAIGMDAATYPIYVKGIQVTDANKDNILGDGKVRLYVASSYYNLFFTNATINAGSSKAVYVTDKCDRKVYLSFAGTNNFTSSSDAIYIANEGNVIFDKSGDGDAIANITSTGTGDTDAIFLGSSTTGFTISKNVTINAKTSGAYGIRNYNTGSFYIDNANVTAKGGSYSGHNGGIYSAVKPTLTGVFVFDPIWGEYNSKVFGYTTYNDRNSSTASLASTINIVPGEDYGVRICGIGVNSTNYSTLNSTLKSKGYLTAGTASYITSSSIGKYISFNGVTLKYSGNIVWARDNATIIYRGVNNFANTGNSFAFTSDAGLEMRYYNNSENSSASLICESGIAFQSSTYLRFYKTKVDATTSHSYGASCGTDFTVTDSYVSLTSTKSAISGAKTFTMNGSYTYDGSYYDTTNKQFVDYEKAAKKLAIIRRGYGIRVNDTEITMDNLSVGEVSYNASANKLTIGNYACTSDSRPLEIYKKGLTIETTGTCSLTSNKSIAAEIVHADNVTLTGKGKFETISKATSTGLGGFPAFYAYKTNINIEETTLNAKGLDYGIYINGGKLTINHSNVSTYGDKDCATASDGITLKDCEITTPEGAKTSSTYFTDKNGNLLKGTTCKITPADYNIWISGTQVTSKNASKITGSNIFGTLSYDRASKTLTLNNANIVGTNNACIRATEDITIKLIGDNYLSREGGAPFATSENTTITSSSNGTLTSSASKSSYNFLIGNDGTTTIENCTVNIDGGTSGFEDFSGSGDLPSLVINNANVNIDAVSYAVYRLKSLTLSNCYYMKPSNAVFEAAKGYITTSGNICSDVQIKAGQLTKYGFTVAGTEVTNANADDVLCDGGKVKYDDTTKTLTLNNATIDGGNHSGIQIQTIGSTLKIQLIGNNKVKSTKFNGIYAGNTSLEISGSSNATLDVSTDYEGTNGYSPIMLYGSGKHTFSNCKITTNNKNYGIRANGSSTITLDGVTLNGNVTANSIFAGALADFKTINLKNSTIKSTSSGIYTKDIAASINLDGANNITSTEAHGIMLEGVASTTSTISSKTGGSLDITATSDGMCEIMFGTSLLVKDCTLTGRGYSGGLSGQTEWQYLTIDNATVKAKATDNSSAVGAIDGISKLELKNGIQIISPEGAAYNESLYGIAKDGVLCKSVEIGVKGYSIKVDGKSITSQNCNDVLGDGKVKFNPETNTLTLNNATITSSNQALLIGAGTYTLDLIGNNTITGTNLGLAVALGVLNVTSSTGTGKLTCSAAASGNSTGAIATAIGAITIENCTVEAKNSVGIAINGLEAGALTIKNANVTANGKEACIAGFTELNLEGCYIDEPGGAEIKAEGEYKSVYLAGSYAKDQNVVIKSGDNPHIVPPTIPSTLVNVSNLTHESFSLSWTAATDNDTPQSDIVYFITYTNKTTGEMLTKEVTGETTATIGGLASETTYEVTLRAYDKDGNNALYGTLNVITSAAPDVTAPILPTDAQIAVTDVTTKSVTISWNAATDDRSTADAINYKVEWNIGDTFVNSTTLNGSTTTYEILNLTPETEYTITVTAIDEAGNTADYTPLKVSTLAEVDETAPSLPADATIYVNEATEKSLTIAWFAASDDKTDASNLQYEVNILVNGEWKTLPIVTGATTCKIEDLEPGTEYKIAVYVYDEAGNSMCYDVLTTSTEAVDAIDAILADNPDVKMYNTSGVLVNKNYRGVVIINGKKYMKTK